MKTHALPTVVSGGTSFSTAPNVISGSASPAIVCKPKTRDNRLKNEKHRQKPAKQRRNAERAGKREEYWVGPAAARTKGGVATVDACRDHSRSDRR